MKTATKYIFYLALIYLLLEGVLRKWVLPGSGQILFFIKHVLLIIMYVKAFVVDRLPFRFPYYKSFLLVYFLYGYLMSFNFTVSDNYIVQFFGILNHFLYIPLIPFLYHYFSDKDSILKFIKVVGYFSVPVLILGIVQYYSPQYSIINKYAVEEEVGTYVIATAGDKVRITSVFSYLAIYGVYLISIGVLFFYRIMYSAIQKKVDKVMLVLYIAVIVNLLMTGSRGGVLILIVYMSVFFLVLSFSGRVAYLKSLQPIIIAASLGIIVMITTGVANDALDSFMTRAESNEDLDARSDRLFNPFLNLDRAGYFGLGIGVAYQGTQQFITDRRLLPDYFEEEADRVVLEIGLVGYVMMTLCRLFILFYSIYVYRQVKDEMLKMLPLLIAIMQFLPVIGFSQMIFSFMDGFFYYFFAGVVFAVQRIDAEQNLQ